MQALEKAWKDAMGSATPTKILIPAGTWILKQAHLVGPNKAPVELQVKGTVKALEDPKLLPNKEFEWITVNYVNFFTLSGGGVFDGMGKTAWTLNDCHVNSKCQKLPIVRNYVLYMYAYTNQLNMHDE